MPQLWTPLTHTSASALLLPPLTVATQTHIAHCAPRVIQESVYRPLNRAAPLQQNGFSFMSTIIHTYRSLLGVLSAYVLIWCVKWWAWSPENHLGKEIFFLRAPVRASCYCLLAPHKTASGKFVFAVFHHQCVTPNSWDIFTRIWDTKCTKRLPRGTKAFRCAYKHMYYCRSIRAFTPFLKVRTFMCWLDMHCAVAQTLAVDKILSWVTVKFTQVSSLNYLLHA